MNSSNRRILAPRIGAMGAKLFLDDYVRVCQPEQVRAILYAYY